MTAILRKTPLTDSHVARGAKMTDYAGWSMPLQYTSVLEEHQAVRDRVGIFDLTHMAEFEVRGRDRDSFVQRVTTNDVSRLEVGQALYSCIVSVDDAGILDDVLIYRWDDAYVIVANASNRFKVWNWLGLQAAGHDVALEDLTEDTALIAVQGPKAQEILSPIVPEFDLLNLDFYRAQQGTWGGHHAVVSRTGYTGEDGFELYVDFRVALSLWDALLCCDRVVPVGLAARDTLRLESGFALYGNELTEARTPYDVSLGWVTKLQTDPPPLAALALSAAKERATTCMVGIEIEGRVIARQGSPVHWEGRQVGEVTSGTFSPSLKRGVALAVVERAARSAGTPVEVWVRGKPQPAKVVTLPFVRGSVKRHS